MARNLNANFNANVQPMTQSLDKSINKLQQLENQMRQLQKSSKKMNNLTKNADEFKDKNQEVANTSNNVAKNQKKAGQTVSDFNKEMKSAAQTNESWLSSYTETLRIGIRSTAIWAGATTAIYGTKRALEEIHQIQIDVNREMVAVERVMNDAITNYNEMQRSAAELGVEFAENVDMVVESMVGWARQGYEQVEVLELTEAALLASNVAQMDAAQSVDLLTSAILQFNMEAAEATEIVDRLNEVANNYAVTAENLAMSIRESGAAANAAGVSMDELIGITTSLSAATAKSGNRIGRALRTMFSRMLGDANDSGEALGQVEIALNNVGIALRQSEDEYRDLTDVITDLAISWDDLDEVMQANIARSIGGRRRYSDMIAIIENWDMALDATETSMDALDSAIEENERYMESMQAQWDQARAQLEQLAITAGDFAGETLSIGMANALQTVYAEMENSIHGIQAIQKAIENLEGAAASAVRLIGIGGLATAVVTLGNKIGTALIPALTALKAHPVIATLGVISTVTLEITRRMGDNAQRINELENSYDQLNSVIEEGNQLSLEQTKVISDIIDETQEAITAYERMQAALPEGREGLTGAERFAQRFGEIFSWMRRGADDPFEVFAEGEEALEDLKIMFEDLAEEFRDPDTGEFITERTDEFIDEVAKKLINYQNELENTVSWIARYSSEQAEATQQGFREARMLESKAERYNNLANEANRTAKEEAELIKIRHDMLREFPELLDSSKDFGDALQELANKQMKSFTEEGGKIEQTIADLKKDIQSLSDAEDELGNEKQDLAKELINLKQKLEDTDIDKEPQKYLNLLQSVEEVRHEYGNFIDQSSLAFETMQDLEMMVAQLNEEFEDEEAIRRFWSNVVEASSILNEFGQDLVEIEAQIQDLDDTLEAQLNFAELKAELKDLGKIDELELIKGAFEDTQGTVLGLIEDLKMLEIKPQSAETAQRIKQELGDMEEIELDEDIDFERIIEDFDDEEFSNMIEALIEDLISQFHELDKEIEDIGKDIALEELSKKLQKDFSDLDLSELKNIRDNTEEFITNYAKSNDEIEVTNKLLNDTPQLIELILGRTNDWFTLTETISFRKQTSELEELDSTLRSIVDMDEWERETFLTGDIEDDAEIFEQTINNIFDNLTQTNISDFLDEDDELEDDIANLEGIEEQIEDIINRYDYWEDQTDFVLADIATKEELKQVAKELGIEIEDLTAKHEGLNAAQNVLNQYALTQEDRLKNTKEELIEHKEEVEEGTEAYEDIKKAIATVDNELEDLDFQDEASAWRDFSREIDRAIDDNIFDLVILPDDQEQEVEKRIELLSDAIQNAISQDMDFDDENDLEDYSESLQRIQLVIQELDNQYEEINFEEELDLEGLAERAGLAENELENLRNTLAREELQEVITDAELEQMNDLEREIHKTNQELEQYEEHLETAEQEGFADEADRLREIVAELNDEVERQNLLKNLEDTEELIREDIVEVLEDFDINESLTPFDAHRDLQKFSSLLIKIENELAMLEEKDLLDEELEEDYEEIIEKLREVIEDTEDSIRDTKHAWADAISDGLREGFQDVDLEDSDFGEAIADSIVNTLNYALQDDATGLSNILTDRFSEEVTLGIQTTVQGLADGDSVPQSLLSGAGQGMLATGEPTSMLIGGGLMVAGEIGNWLWGGTDVADNIEEFGGIEAVEQLDGDIEHAHDNLEEFGIEMDIITSGLEDEAGWWSSFWGGEDWEADNLEEAKEHLEDIESLLETAEQLSGDMMSGFESAVKENVRYHEIRRHFEQSVGQALQDAVIDNLIETYAIQDEIQEMSGLISKEIEEHGTISDDFMDEELDAWIDEMVEKGEMISDVGDELRDALGLESPDIDAEATFQAGSTRNVVVNNTYQVKAGAFMGSKNEARKFASFIAEFVEEELDREEGVK